MARVTVVGTTSWGTTLAIILANNGSDVQLWARTPEEATVLEQGRREPAPAARLDLPSRPASHRIP